MNDIETTVAQTIRAITSIAERVTRFATSLLLGVAGITIVSFLLGLAALSSGIRTVWIVLGIVFGVIAIGSALVGRWRLGRIRKDVPGLAADVRALIADGRENTIAIFDELRHRDDELAAGSVVVVSRRMYGLRGAMQHGVGGSARLANAVTAVTSFPALALTAVAISLVFGFLAFVFLLALAVS